MKKGLELQFQQQLLDISQQNSPFKQQIKQFSRNATPAKLKAKVKTKPKAPAFENDNVSRTPEVFQNNQKTSIRI